MCSGVYLAHTVETPPPPDLGPGIMAGGLQCPPAEKMCSLGFFGINVPGGLGVVSRKIRRSPVPVGPMVSCPGFGYSLSFSELHMCRETDCLLPLAQFSSLYCLFSSIFLSTTILPAKPHSPEAVCSWRPVSICAWLAHNPCGT